jgi:biotin transporter BioY
MESFMQTFVIFIPGGIVKQVLATVITLSLYRAMPTLRPQERITRVG